MTDQSWHRVMIGRVQDGARRSSTYLAGSPALGGWGWLLFALACTLLLCSSALFFDGHKVDESEVVLNALTIATGEWDPKWTPGYGHLAMYLPAALLSLVALFVQASGAAASYSDGLYLLFADDAAYRWVRLLYTLADVATALLFARIIVVVTQQRLLAAAYFLYFMISPDTWIYANHVRTDTFVSFFAACALYFLAVGRSWFTPYGLGLALGAAIACKYSAVVYVALAACLLIPLRNEERTIRQRLGMVVIAVVVAAVSALVFQPLYDYSGIFDAINKHLAGAHFAREPVPMGERMVRLWRLVLTLEPLAPVLLVAMLPALSRPRQGVALISAVVLGIAPFVLSNFVREYWLIPFADALRAAGWFGVACAVQSIGARAGINARRVLVGLVLAALASAAWVRASTVPPPQAALKHGLSNAEAAKRWLYVHAANRIPIVYGYEKNFLLPRAYSFSSYGNAADLSRTFIFYREDFRTLHDMFQRRLYSKEFSEFSSVTKVPSLNFSVGVGTAERAAKPPTLCMNDRCFPAKVAPCGAQARSRLGECVTYTWDMDRPALRQNLSNLSLKMPSAMSEFAVCWYSCDRATAESRVRIVHQGRVPLLQLADHLFAPASVRRLTEIKNSRGEPGEVYIVTTPVAYRPWLPKNASVGKGTDGAAATFGKLTNSKLIRYFDAGHGPRIEIYARHPKKAPVPKVDAKAPVSTSAR